MPWSPGIKNRETHGTQTARTCGGFLRGVVWSCFGSVDSNGNPGRPGSRAWLWAAASKGNKQRQERERVGRAEVKESIDTHMHGSDAGLFGIQCAANAIEERASIEEVGGQTTLVL
jgi:hypothetical protein